MTLALRISVLLLAAGCVTSNVERLDETTRPARAPDSVAILFEKPQQAYTVIGTIETKGETVFDGYDNLRQRMVADAAQMGGEALILGPEQTESAMIFTATGMIKSDRKKLTADVIVFD